MNPNPSFDDRNQFMPNQAKQNAPKFQDFMKACISNPAFFQTMKNYYDLQQGSGGSQMSSLNVSNQSIVAETGRGAPNDNYEPSRNNNEPKMARLPANPLLKYQPPQTVTVQTYNQRGNVLPQDEIPIKSTYIEKMSGNGNKFSPNLSSLKENQSINIDIEERPNKGRQDKTVNEPVKVDNPSQKYRQFEERPIKSMSKEQMSEYYQQMDKKPSNKPSLNTQNSSALADDERPLTGAKKDFKELIKEQFPQALPLEQQEEEEKKVQPRNFLKRGSRQHLSSAANRSKQPRKQEDLNKSGMDKSRDITPKHQKTETRSISQNRILGKKPSENNNDKSINKIVAKNQEQPQIPKPKPPMQNKVKEEIIPSKPKVETKASEVKKKKKNVFADNSSQSSSSSEDEPFFRANIEPSEIKDENEGKMQVIDSVYLTNEQLEEILTKYGKVAKPAPKESQSEKIQSIRNKYTELCHLVQSEREAHQAELQKQKEQFEKYKADQMNKIKNERRVMERQLKSGSGSQNLQKEKEELETLKQQLERERDEFKKKDKNNKIMIDKYKKEIEQLKAKVERLQTERDEPATKKTINNFIEQSNLDDKSTVSRGITSKTKIEEDFGKEEVSYKDIKKGKDSKEVKQPAKLKYDYEEQPVGKGKVTNIQKEEKIQNKWMTNKINTNIESNSESEGEEAAVAEDTSSFPQWSPTMKLSDLTKIDLSIKMVNEKMINSLFKYQNNIEYRKYMQTVNSPSRTVVNTARNTKNNFVTNLYNDRSKELVYDNGTKKVTLESGFTIVYFKNGDIKQTLPDRTVLYYFKEKDVDQITLSNGVNIYRFQNNQVEFHFDEGHIQIRHPDGTFKVTGPVLRR